VPGDGCEPGQIISLETTGIVESLDGVTR